MTRIAHGEESGRDWLTHFYFGSGEGAARNADEAHEGLQQQVAQLGEIDARAINTIDIGVRPARARRRYGPYLEDMEHLDAEGNPKRASLPDTIAPDELTVAVAARFDRQPLLVDRASWALIRYPAVPSRCAMGVSARMWRWCRRLRLRLALLAILLVLLRPRRVRRRPRPPPRRARRWPRCSRR